MLRASFTNISYSGIFSSTIIGTLNPNNTLTQNIGYGTVVNCFYLPGCIVGGLLMDRIGRKQTMTLGFYCWAIMGFIIGGALGSVILEYLFCLLHLSCRD
jgi:MFS family permease